MSNVDSQREKENIPRESNLSLGAAKEAVGNYSLFTYSSHLCLAAAFEVAGIIQRDSLNLFQKK